MKNYFLQFIYFVALFILTLRYNIYTSIEKNFGDLFFTILFYFILVLGVVIHMVLLFKKESSMHKLFFAYFLAVILFVSVSLFIPELAHSSYKIVLEITSSLSVLIIGFSYSIYAFKSKKYFIPDIYIIATLATFCFIQFASIY